MRHAIGLALIAVCAFAQETGTIEGRVTNPATGAGIAGVTVTVRAVEGAITTTDASGSYRVSNLLRQRYGLEFAKEGYYVPRGEALFPNFEWNSAGTARIDARLLPYLTLRGRVLDADGNPVANAKVGLLPQRFGEKTTDTEGRFEFDRLEPGVYRLRAAPPVENAVWTYFPSAIDTSTTQPILLRSSTLIGDYDVQLRSSQLYRVAGVVLDESGKPAKDATVRLIGTAGHGTESPGFGTNSSFSYFMIRPEGRPPGAETKSDEHGRFEFAAVKEGSWRVQAMSAPYEEIESRNVVSGGGTEIAVSGRDVGDLEIRLARPFNLQVLSDWGSKDPPKEIPAMPIRLWPSDGQPQPAGMAVDPPRYDEIVPGRYRIVEEGFAPSGFYLAAVMMGSQDVLDQEIELSANTPPLRAMFKSGDSTVHVKVEKGDGLTVLLVPVSSPREAKRLATIRTQTMTGNSIDLVSVPPGDYALAAFDRVERALFESTMVLDSIVTSATPLHVEAGANSAVELRVSHWAW